QATSRPPAGEAPAPSDHVPKDMPAHSVLNAGQTGYSVPPPIETPMAASETKAGIQPPYPAPATTNPAHAAGFLCLGGTTSRHYRNTPGILDSQNVFDSLLAP